MAVSGRGSYTYDGENRLTVLGNSALTNTYDGDGARAIRVANGATTHFVGGLYEYNLATSTPTAYDAF